MLLKIGHIIICLLQANEVKWFEFEDLIIENSVFNKRFTY